MTNRRLTLYWAIPLALAATFAVLSTVSAEVPNKAFIAIGTAWAFASGIGIGAFIGSKHSEMRS